MSVPEGKKIIAVDFDGTLHLGSDYPFIGEPNIELIDFLKEHRKEFVLILWTMREGKQLAFAKKWLQEQGLTFDFYNDNAYWLQEKYNYNPRKIYADFYIDNRNATLDTLREVFKK